MIFGNKLHPFNNFFPTSVKHKVTEFEEGFQIFDWIEKHRPTDYITKFEIKYKQLCEQASNQATKRRKKDNCN
jgi:hypothetical protein